MRQTGSAVAAPQALFRIELLGEFRLLSVGEPLLALDKARLQSLLSYLILHDEAPQPRENLAFIMWPDSGDAQARTNLRHLLHHLRRALPAECGSLTADQSTVQWRRGSTCTVDVAEFEDYLSVAEQTAAGGDPKAERTALSNAARLYKDDLLPALYDEWLRGKREQYRQKAAQVFERLASLLEDEKDYAAAIRHAERLVAHDPVSEAHYQRLIRLHAANGDRASALRAYHQCRGTLRRELGVEPSATIRGLFERVLKLDRPAVTPTGHAPTIDSGQPIIGREKEWRGLLDLWKTSSGGGVHLAAIHGDPGIGKSRLAQQLRTHVKQEQAAAAHARCYAAQGRLAYAPVAEWLIADPLRRACAQLPRSQALELARVVPEALSERRPLSGSQSLLEGWERRLFYDALTAAFAKAQKPLLLILDDVQWCDQDSLEWLHFLFRAELNGGVLVLVTCRQNELVRGHPFTKLLGELRLTGQAQELSLLPLDAAETASLGSQTANRPLNETEAAELYRATQGNPLFVVESVRSGCTGTGAPMPSRVHAVIVDRLAQLTAPAHELAGYISAIGQAFSVDLVTRATDWDDESLTKALDELSQRRIVEHKAGAEYDFTHDLIREATHAELSPVRKRFLHRRLARALEEMYAADIESNAGKIAAHYAQGDLAEEAIRYHLIAGRAAHYHYADREAAAEFYRALALCRELPPTVPRKEQEIELLMALQRTLLITHGYAAPEVGEALGPAIALLRELNTKQHAVQVLNVAVFFHVVRAELAEAKQVGDDLLDLVAAGGGAITSLAAQCALGMVQFLLGRHDLSQQHLEQALADESRCTPEELALFPTPAVRVFCQAFLSHQLWHRGSPDRALATIEETIASASEAHPFGLAIALNYGAMLHVFRGEIQAAHSRAQAAADVCRRYDLAYYSSMAEIVSGWSRAMLGDSVGGLTELRKGFEALRASGAELRLPFYHALTAEAYGRAEQRSEALAHISDGLAFLIKNGEAWAAPHVHLVHGDLLQRPDDPQEALTHYRKALEAAQRTGAHSLALRAAVRICQIDPEPHLPMLRGLFDQFTEGFDSKDLVDASQLLSGAAWTAATMPAP